MPVQGTRVDAVALGATLAALAAWVAAPQGAATPYLAIAAGLLLGLRLSRWCGLATLREPLLFVLHAGYGWLAFGLVLLGLNALAPVLPPSTALHALTMGAIGTMTLAVMTRATLGHTGHDLVASATTQLIYALVVVAASARVGAALAIPWSGLLLELAVLAWASAFIGFAVAFGPLLWRRRKSAVA